MLWDTSFVEYTGVQKQSFCGKSLALALLRGVQLNALTVPLRHLNVVETVVLWDKIIESFGIIRGLSDQNIALKDLYPKAAALIMPGEPAEWLDSLNCPGWECKILRVRFLFISISP